LRPKTRLFIVAVASSFMLLVSTISNYIPHQYFMFSLSIGLGIILFALFTRNTPSTYEYDTRLKALYKYLYIFAFLHIVVVIYKGSIPSAYSGYDYDTLAVIDSSFFYPSKIFSTVTLLATTHLSLLVCHLVTHFVAKGTTISRIIGLIGLIFGMVFGVFFSIFLVDNVWFISLMVLSTLCVWLIYKHVLPVNDASSIVLGW
jgi:hypothetical protein